MIVDTMTDLEVFHEIGRDRETVRRWFRAQLGDRRREILKSRRFPKRFWLEYTSQRMVQYMIGVTVFDRRMRGMAVVFMALRRTQEGVAVYNTWLDSDDENPQMVLTPHALKQYGRRMGIDKSGVELVQEFFNRNHSSYESFNQKAVGRSVRYNGEKHVSSCVKDGVLLGQLHNGNIHVVRTFITYDMCSGLQEEAFGQYNGQHRTYEDEYERVKNRPIKTSPPAPLQKARGVNEHELNALGPKGRFHQAERLKELTRIMENLPKEDSLISHLIRKDRNYHN